MCPLNRQLITNHHCSGYTLQLLNVVMSITVQYSCVVVQYSVVWLLCSNIMEYCIIHYSVVRLCCDTVQCGTVVM